MEFKNYDEFKGILYSDFKRKFNLDLSNYDKLLKLSAIFYYEYRKNYDFDLLDISLNKFVSNMINDVLNYMEFLFQNPNYYISKLNSKALEDFEKDFKKIYLDLISLNKKLNINYFKDDNNLNVLFIDFYNLYKKYVDLTVDFNLKLIDLINDEKVKLNKKNTNNGFDSLIFH
jgi:hypothetical protein